MSVGVLGGIQDGSLDVEGACFRIASAKNEDQVLPAERLRHEFPSLAGLGVAREGGFHQRRRVEFGFHGFHQIISGVLGAAEACVFFFGFSDLTVDLVARGFGKGIEEFLEALGLAEFAGENGMDGHGEDYGSVVCISFPNGVYNIAHFDLSRLPTGDRSFFMGVLSSMATRESCIATIKKFRAKQGIEATDENTIATIHLMNTHGLDVHAALDQSSRNANDNGIDAWYYDPNKRELFIYQSKLSDSRSTALKGLRDLDRACAWIQQVVVKGSVERVPDDNHCLFNLYTHLAKERDLLKRVNLVLISPFDPNDLEDTDEYGDFERELVNVPLNKFLSERQGRLNFACKEYNLEQGIPHEIKVYPIPKIADARITLRNKAHLDIAFVTLYSLVELYRQRGDILFDKNVRLSLIHSKEARDRLLTPMEGTLDQITSGKISPSIFPFYHIGVTLAAFSSGTSDDGETLDLEAPSIINGCQTIAIAHDYLKRLERQKNEEAIALFHQVRVIAKVVVGTSNEELKEITNSNNRQNPIENWQLFSNEGIHIEIEAALKDLGVFYERQKGKFESVMRNTDNAKHYWATNGTYVKIMDLAQVIALSRSNLQAAAKPSDIFSNKENHDKTFDRSIPRFPHDIIFVSNLFKALKRGLNNYLELPTHANSNAPVIFKKPIVRHHVYRLALLSFYQNSARTSMLSEFSSYLTKIASAKLVDEAQAFYQKVVFKTRNWYTQESKDLTTEISKKKMDAFFANVAFELGLDPVDGSLPFTSKGIDGGGSRAMRASK